MYLLSLYKSSVERIFKHILQQIFRDLEGVREKTIYIQYTYQNNEPLKKKFIKIIKIAKKSQSTKLDF